MKKIKWQGDTAYYLNLLRLEVTSLDAAGGLRVGWRISGVTGVLDEETVAVINGTYEAQAAVIQVAQEQCEAQARHRLGKMTGVPELAVSSSAVLTLLDTAAPAMAIHNLRCALDTGSKHVYGGDNPDARRAFIDLQHQIEGAL